MSAHTHPKLIEIDDALAGCKPCLEEFAQTHGFTLIRSHSGSCNVPRRWLHREVLGCFQEIGLIIALPFPERLERGFYPDIPCSLYVAAGVLSARKQYHTWICEARPFRSFKESLGDHLADAIAKLDACTPDFVSRHGVEYQVG